MFANASIFGESALMTRLRQSAWVTERKGVAHGSTRTSKPSSLAHALLRQVLDRDHQEAQASDVGRLAR